MEFKNPKVKEYYDIQKLEKVDKESNNLTNKLKAEGEALFLNKEASNILTEAFTPKMFSKQLDDEIIAQSPNANSILQTLLQASRYSANKIDNESITQNTNSFYSKFKNRLNNIDNNLAKERENLKDTQELKDSNTESYHKSQLRKQK